MITSIIHQLFGMYRFYWLLCAICLAPHFMSAQRRPDIQQKMDMLQGTLPVTVRIDYMNEISDYLFYSFEDSLSVYFAEEAHRLADKFQYIQGLADACLNLGGIMWYSGQFQKSLNLHKLALKAFEEMGDEGRLAKTHFGMSKLYLSMNQNELAKKHMQEASPVLMVGCERKPDSICVYVLAWQGRIQINDKDFKGGRNSLLLAIEYGYGIQSRCKEYLYYAYLNLGWLEQLEGHYEASIDAYRKAIHLFDSSPYVRQIKEGDVIQMYHSIGTSYAILENYSQAIYYWGKAEVFCPEDYALAGQTLTTLFLKMANAYLILDMPGQAQSYINRALTAAKKRNDDRVVAFCHQLLGGLLRQLEYWELAIEDYQIAVSLYEKTDELYTLGYALHHRGRAQLNMNQKEKAINSFKQAQLFGSKFGQEALIRNSLSGRLEAGDTSVTYQQLIALSLTELKKAVSLLNVTDIAGIYASLIDGYYATHDFASSEDYAYQLLSQANKLNDPDLKLSAYKYLADISQKLDKNDLAYEFADKAYLLKDTIQEKKNRRLIAEIQFRNESNLQQEEIEKLNQERENTNLTLKIQEERFHSMTLEQERAHFINLYQLQQLDLLTNQQELSLCEVENNQAHIKVQAGEMRQKEDQLSLMEKESEVQQLAFGKQKAMKNISFAGLGVIALLFLLVRKNYITNQKLKLHMVRNKIAADLHDEVGGTLSSIQLFSEIAKQQSREVIPMLDTISDSAKKMLDAMTDIVWTINPENDDVEKILDRMRSFAFELLNAKKIEFEFNANEELHELKLPMEVRRSVYLIFKESTNNLVKYANASRVHFSIKEENRNLTMMIQDNGKGFDTSQATKGNGLNNMKKRAEEIGGHLRIESKQNEGTTITLRLAV